MHDFAEYGGYETRVRKFNPEQHALGTPAGLERDYERMLGMETSRVRSDRAIQSATTDRRGRGDRGYQQDRMAHQDRQRQMGRGIGRPNRGRGRGREMGARGGSQDQGRPRYERVPLSGLQRDSEVGAWGGEENDRLVESNGHRGHFSGPQEDEERVRVERGSGVRSPTRAHLLQ